GENEANRPQIHRRQGSTKAISDQSRSEISSGDRRSEETAQIPAGDGGTSRNPEVPEEHGAVDPLRSVSSSYQRTTLHLHV
ncbi:hypothetical protein L1987_69933, partial [Smallanthus sonchifolius]